MLSMAFSNLDVSSGRLRQSILLVQDFVEERSREKTLAKCGLLRQLARRIMQARGLIARRQHDGFGNTLRRICFSHCTLKRDKILRAARIVSSEWLVSLNSTGFKRGPLLHAPLEHSRHRKAYTFLHEEYPLKAPAGARSASIGTDEAVRIGAHEFARHACSGQPSKRVAYGDETFQSGRSRPLEFGGRSRQRHDHKGDYLRDRVQRLQSSRKQG